MIARSVRPLQPTSMWVMLCASRCAKERNPWTLTQIPTLWLSFPICRVGNTCLMNVLPGVICIWALVDQCPQEIHTKAKSTDMNSDCHPQTLFWTVNFVQLDKLLPTYHTWVDQGRLQRRYFSPIKMSSVAWCLADVSWLLVSRVGEAWRWGRFIRGGPGLGWGQWGTHSRHKTLGCQNFQ